MMIIRLFCPQCVLAAKNGLPHATIEVPMPMAHVLDDGHYEVRCDAGHVSSVYLDNLKFELLFELGLNALLDGSPREAVSSFAGALERFYEFFWHVAMAQAGISPAERNKVWKDVAKQSERQLGMFITAHLCLVKKAPALLSPNKEVKLRNDVIHGGYIPTIEEATGFGNSVMRLVNGALDELRQTVPETLLSTYDELSPEPKGKTADDDLQGVTNILCAIDVRHPAQNKDLRIGSVTDQFARIHRDREPHRLELLSTEEMGKCHAEISDQLGGKADI